ncbi:1-(5-phosphoribosyl)-5-[(5-phosphoribosylamino)methylideneamino]imidazole-4-carboxamide isomerase [bacterium]|nr:MAG: 1-(5-phosphoribosyl)-5-[(5-phosphoribosylamino)methylideneamino]imidazole-4-carboxamide isomerase [bacterium]
MIIIPAVDIKDGKCVRLTQGRMDAVTVYADSPVDMAIKWESLGAELIHLVDLDGAIAGNTKNFSVIKNITSALKTPVQIGGGIRDIESAEKYLNLPNVKRIIMGTAAHKDKNMLLRLTNKYPGRVAVGVDAKDGFVAINGWVTVTEEKASDLAKSLESSGTACIIYTDIARDGMLKGPNVTATKELAQSIKIPVVASGGVSSINDIKAYAGVNVEGIIIGKALYSGGLDLREAIKTVAGF